MRQRGKTRRFGLASIVALTICAVSTVAAVSMTKMSGRGSWSPHDKYTLAQVRRTDLKPSLTTSGRIESSKKTLIECELERISIGILGQGVSAGGSSFLLSVVPDGSIVQKGDVLAVLDSSDYEELLRQQRITVERSKSDHQQAKLNLEIAKLAVREFDEGTRKEAIKDFERSLALARSDVSRISDRLAWTRRMEGKKYVPVSQVKSEEYNQARALFNLAEQTAAYELYNHWTVPKTLRTLQGAVLAATATFGYQEMRLRRNLDRLAKLEKQVSLCTIKAPHDGFIIYANDERRDIQIEAGMTVRQRQDLFYLPDLNDMEVVAMVHESVIDDVRKGLTASVQVEGMPQTLLSGHVTAIAQIPTFNWRSDVRYFDAIVKLDHGMRGLKPGMTAEVEIMTSPRDNVLAVPAEAVTTVDGREVCYVAHGDGLECREIKTGQVTRDLFEVSKGLKEGEEVVLNPPHDQVQDDLTATTGLTSDETLAESPANHPAAEVAAR